MLGYLFTFDIANFNIHSNYTYKTILSLHEASTNKEKYFDILTKIINRDLNTFIPSTFGFQYIDFGNRRVNGRQELIQIYKQDNKAYITKSNPLIIINSKKDFDKYLPEKYYDSQFINAPNLVFCYETKTKCLSVCTGCFVDTTSTSDVWLISSYTAYRFDFKYSFDSLTDYTKFVLENEKKC